MRYKQDDLLVLCNEDNPAIDVEALYLLCNDADDEVRRMVAELLAYDKSEKTKCVLFSLLQTDPDELVRAEAADSLSCFESEELLAPLLATFDKETSDMVKSYILLAVSDIANCFDGQLIYSEMERRFATEQAWCVRSVCAGYLYRHGNKDMLTFLQNGLKSKDFYIRKWAEKRLLEIFNHAAQGNLLDNAP